MFWFVQCLMSPNRRYRLLLFVLGVLGQISAQFLFSSNGTQIPLKYPEDLENGIFNQFAVFDGEIGKRHLKNRRTHFFFKR